MKKILITLTLLCCTSIYGEAKPPLEWRETVRQQIADDIAALDPTLVLGCSIDTQHYFKKGQFYGLPVSDEQTKAADAFQEFIQGDGAPMVARLLAGESLAPENQKYKTLINAYIIDRAFRGRQPAHRVDNWDAFQAYSSKVEREGQEVLRKAYTGGEWTQEDVDKLRLFGFWVDAKCTMARYMPNHFELTTPESALSAGKTPPTLIAARPQVYWEQPGFNNQSIFDPRYTLKDDYMNEFFNIIEGLNITSGQNPTHRYGLQFENLAETDLFKLENFKGKKPVFLAFVGPTDTWNWHGKLVPWIDVMKHAYGDQIEFALIATTVHDSIMGSRDYFGPLMTGSPKMPAPHPPTIEERARRVKMFYMTFPYFTINYYLDSIHQTLRDTFRDQGGNFHILIINKDGTVAAHNRSSTINPYVSGGSWKLFPRFLHARANEQEQMLHAMIENGGQLPGDFKYQYEEPEQEVVWDRFTVWLKGTLNSTGDSTLTVTGTVNPDEMIGYHLWKNATEKTFMQNSAPQYSLPVVEHWIEKEGGQPVRTFGVEENTVITLNGRQASLADLQSGDIIGVFYKCSDDQASTVPALLIRATRL